MANVITSAFQFILSMTGGKKEDQQINHIQLKLLSCFPELIFRKSEDKKML